MKILILVLSYNDGVYAELMKSQQATWDSIDVPGVQTFYYHGGLYNEGGLDFLLKFGNGRPTWERLQFKCTDEYYYMAAKFKMMLDYIHDEEYDLIFRTNSSSYVNKQRLKEFAETLPKEKLYAGWTMVDSEDHGGLVVSGAGIFMSRDVAEILREQIDPTVEREEDIEIGRILRRNGITAIDDKSRIDWPYNLADSALYEAYHIRFKTSDRQADAINMKIVHQLINHK